MAQYAVKPFGIPRASHSQEVDPRALTDWPRVVELLTGLDVPRAAERSEFRRSEIVVPPSSELRDMSATELHKTIASNHAKLIEMLTAARDDLPILGFHGRLKAKLEELVETKNCTNREGRNVGTQVTTVVRKDESAASRLADLYSAVGYTFAYANPTELATRGVSYEPGGIVVVRMRTLPGLNRVSGVEVRPAEDLDMGLEGESKHFGTAAVFITPETYSEVVLGVIPHSRYGDIEALRSEIGAFDVNAENYQKLRCLLILQEQVVVREALQLAGAMEQPGRTTVSNEAIGSR